jgi:hypothetical protein
MLRMPVNAPMPPSNSLKTEVMTIATMVGINPKYNPDMPIRMDRVSKITPLSSVQWVSIRIIPINPIITPVGILCLRILELCHRMTKKSKINTSISSNAVL